MTIKEAQNILKEPCLLTADDLVESTNVYTVAQVNNLLEAQKILTRSETIKECMNFMETMEAEAQPGCDSCKFTARQIGKLYQNLRAILTLNHNDNKNM